VIHRAQNVLVTDYGRPLREEDIDRDPLAQFAIWFRDAQTAGIRLPEAAALATASVDAAPAARMVLVKSFDARGFVFYSNYASRKGHELDANPRAALLFYWDPLGRQVRIEGPVERVSASDSAAYARSRPRGSQLSALASPQSQTIAGRVELEQRVAELQERYGTGALPVPSCWGGFRLAAESVEFWQQRQDRLHDRLRYRRRDDAAWVVARLAP
jgi:pyridoxamine 5'-phosphate oxidase